MVTLSLFAVHFVPSFDRVCVCVYELEANTSSVRASRTREECDARILYACSYSERERERGPEERRAKKCNRFGYLDRSFVCCLSARVEIPPLDRFNWSSAD